jgi:hypothetical protein
MSQVNVASLVIKVAATNPAEAKRLAERVVSGLSRLSLAPSSEKATDVLRTRVRAEKGMSRESLADRIVAELIREIEHR